MEEREEIGAAAEPAPADQAAAPLLLVPVTAEDFARRRLRLRLAIAGGAILAVLGALYAYQRYTAPMRALESYDSGERLYKIARYSQAIVSLDAAIGLMPDFAEAYLLRGRARMGLSDVEGAIPEFTKVIQLRPAEAGGYVARGAAYLELKNYPAALADCDRAVQFHPRLAAAYNLKGSVIRAMGNPGEALALFDRAVELEGSLDNYFQRGATYQMLGRHEQAILDFDRAIEFHPFSPEAYFARANSRRAIGDLTGAQADHDHGRALDRR